MFWGRVDWWCEMCGDIVNDREFSRSWLVWRFPFFKHAADDWSNGIDRDDLYGECGPIWPTRRIFVVALAIRNWWWDRFARKESGKEDWLT